MVRYIEAISSFKFQTVRSLARGLLNGAICKRFQRFHAGEDVRPVTSCKFLLEEVKSQFAEIKITKPKNNLSRKEHEALTELKQNTDINLKKADKGSTTVVMNKTDKIREGQIEIEDKHNYRPLSEPMVKETHSKVLRLTTWCYGARIYAN